MSTQQAYVPLHLHSEYSLLDGAIRVKQLCEFAKENNMPAVAITDHGVMYSAIEFYRTAKEMGVKSIIGCEFYVHDGDIHEKNAAHNPLYHLVLLAKDKDGYMNLVKLVSIAHCEGMYYKPRINHELIEKHHEGLICLSACVQGEIAQGFIQGNKEASYEAAKFYKGLFGEDYYIDRSGEIMSHSAYCVSLPVATGTITKKYATQYLAGLGRQIVTDPFWNNQIQQVMVKTDGKVELVPRVGEHIIMLGKPVNVKEKLDRMKIFYTEGLNKVGWNKYSAINLEYDNQVICKKKK